MMTVKVVGIHGDESVFQARHVVATRKNRQVDSNTVKVECFDEKYEPIHVAGLAAIEFGTVYVMNDNGKTVAAYYLAQE